MTAPYPSELATGTVPRDRADATSDQSVGEYMSAIASNLSTLMRQELELAKAELKAEAAKTGRAAGMLGGAGFAGYMVLVAGTFACIFAIATLIGLGWAAFTMTVAWAIVGAVLYALGRTQLRRVHPKPERTVESLKEDMEWARHPTS